MTKLAELESAPIGKLLWKYSIPAVVGILVMSTYNIIDRIFIGQGVGANAIAGLAVTFPLMNISAALGTLVGVGAAARISIALGEKNKRLAEFIIGNSLVLTTILAVSYTVVFGIFLKDILYMFGASDATIPYAYDYIIHLLPGFILINLCYSFNNMMRASGYPKKAMITMIIGAVGNLILDPIFIFWLDMGIKGAAIATVISMAISAFFVMWHFCSPKSELKFNKGTYRLKWKLILSICSIGAAPCLINVAGSAVNGIVNNSLLLYGGDNAVGAAGIFTTYTQLLCMIVIGVCQGMQPIIGYNYGAGQIHRLKRTYITASIVATIICTLGAMGSVFAPHWIARAFTSDEGLIAVTVNGLRISTVLFWVVGMQIVSTNLFQSLGKAGKSIFLSLIRQAIFLIPLLFTLPYFFQLDGIWAAFPASDILSTIVTIWLVVWQFKHLKVKPGL
ncbi:MAG: MATE family efflux transporter [Muribaculaceae bacterium]|nr:MATE family efflux transporter [Muribaculaceae bacterium]